MRWVRIPLTFSLALLVLLDLQLAGMMLQHGFPPVAIINADENGGFLLPTTEDRISYGCFSRESGWWRLSFFG